MANAMNWESVIRLSTGLPSGAPGFLVAAIALVAIFWVVVLPSAILVEYLDRKLTADFQARVGPNRAGPAGLLQPIADFIKLLQKEAPIRLSLREKVWIGIHTMVLYSTVAVLPLGSLTLLVDTDMSAFIPFWSALVLAFGIMFFSLSQNTVPGWIGGVRMAGQALAGAFPAMIALLTVGTRTGGFRWSQIAQSQGVSLTQWNLTANPFQFLSFLVFMLSGLVLLGVAPFDGGLSSSDIQGGVTSNLYGRRLSLFKLGRFYGFFLWSVIAVVLFLGAWNLPGGMLESLRENESWSVIQGLELLTVMLKAFLLMLIVVWASRVSPRGRVDHVTDFAWKILSPIALLSLVGGSLCAGWAGLS
jgi:NADH-quinone oxidoreductase subunit H